MTLRYIDVSGARTEETFQPVLERLNERSDRPVELNFSTVPYQNLRSKLFTMLGSGNPPDVAAVDQIWLGSFVDSGKLMRLDDIAAENDFGDHLPAFEQAVTYDGGVFGVPITTDVRGMYWNREQFADAGLDPDTPPETWDDLLEAAAAVQDPPETYGAVYLAVGGRWVVNLFAAGGHVLSTDGTQPRFHEPPGVEAATFIDELYNERSVGPPNPRYRNGARTAREFLGGQYAIDVVEGSWLHAFWPNVRDEEVPIEERFGFAPTPWPAGGSPATMSGGFVWTGFETTDHPELVREFLRLISERSFKRRVAKASRRIPTRESLLDDAEIWREIPYAETKRELIRHTRTRPIRNWKVVADRLDTALQQVAFDVADPEEALDRAAQEVRSIAR